ncbi:MAG: LysR family transcriptional regulator [Rhodocyclaceae bacterium]|nr:LysR family transcriptional regulator [Rhodocyclaceae bacterium]
MADRRLQVFHTVAKQLSFTKAADVLFMTQPAVTFQIKQLEEHFNTRLFDRGHGKITLTPAGEVVLGYAERILSLSAEMDVRVAEMTGQVGGALLIGASTTIAEFFLPPILGAFKALYPKVSPRLVVGNSETIETRVQEHSLDIGLIESASHQPNLQTETCCDDELQVICAPSSPLACHESLTPDQLVGHDYVSREQGSGTREFAETYLRKNGVSMDSLNMVMELGSPEAIKGVVGSGLGFSVMSKASVVLEQELGALVAIPFQPRLIRTLSLVYPREKFRSRLVNTFVGFALDRLRENSVEA